MLWALLAIWVPVSLTNAILVMLVGGLAGGVAHVAFFTIFMQWASLDQAGTDFTVLQCTERCTNIVAAVIAGQVASRLGFSGLFIATSLIGILAIAWIAFALLRLARQSSAPPSETLQENM